MGSDAIYGYTGIVPRRDQSAAAMIGEVASMALLLPVSTLVGGGIGYLIDRAFGTHFLWIVFGALGTAGGLIELIRELQRNAKAADE
jgi:F0F1-type ATP synthase assembly protein I